jgi:nucleotide-binding universal stress UspA family protein
VEGIIRHARCPVLTAGPKAKAPLQGPFSFNTIVFATDFDSDAAGKASIALAFGQDNAAKIYLCHVLDQPGRDICETLGLQLKFESALEKLIPQSTYDWCTPECVVEQGDAASHVLRLAKKVGADLIILGAKRSSSWFAHLVEGVVGHVLVDAECPVITVCAT